MTEDLKATIAAAADTRATIAAAVDAQAARIAGRIPAWFAERAAWRQAELRNRAWQDGIEIEAWVSHPAIRATGLRGVVGKLHEGSPDFFYVLDGAPGP